MTGDRQNSMVTLYVPCDTIPVKVRVSFGDGLSAVEQIALRAIDALARDRLLPGAEPNPNDPVTSAERLSSILGLGLRVTLDLLHDLWRKGYVVLDFANGDVTVPPHVATAISDGNLGSLPGAELAEFPVELMIDRLTGLVRMLGGSRRPPVPRNAVEIEHDDTAVARVPRAELMAMLEYALQRQDRRIDGEDGPVATSSQPEHRDAVDRRPRVQAYRPIDRGDVAAGEQRWLPLDVLVEEDTDSERLVVTVRDSGYPAARRTSAGERISQIVAEQPTSQLARMLRQAARKTLVDPPVLDSMLDNLAKAADTLDAVPAGRRLVRHAEMCDEARICAGQIGNRIRSEVAARLVPADRQIAELLDVISSARRQLLLVTPNPLPHHWQAIHDAVADRLDAGVSVMLLWGTARKDKLPGPLHTQLKTLERRQTRGLFRMPQVSTCVRVGLAVADDRRALLTSRDILAPGHASRAPTLAVSGVGTDGSDAIRALLAWAGRAVPEGSMSRLLLVTEDDFSDASAARRAAVPEAENLPAAPDDRASAQAQLTAWRDAWASYAADQMERVAAREHPSATLVEDAAHADLLWQAVRTARYRLVLAAERVDRRVVNERFIEHLRKRLAAGVRVTIAGVPSAPTANSSDPMLELRGLEREFPAQVVFSERVGRVLIRDDEVTFSSFDFLRSATADAARPRHLRQAELGIRLGSARFADELAREFGEPAWAGAAAPAARPLSPAAEPRAPMQVIVARQRLLRDFTSDAEGAGLVHAELSRAPDPWALVADLDAHTDGDLRRIAIAASLVQAPADPGTQRRWRRRLAEVCWYEGDFFAAAALRRTDGDPGLRPSTHLAAVAAAWHLSGTGDALTEVYVEDLLTDPEERAVIHAVAVASLLRSGDSAAADIVQELAKDADERWRDFGSAVYLAWGGIDGRSLVPLIAQVLADDREEQRVDDVWDALDEALRLAGQQASYVGKAVRAHQLLFGPQGEFGRIVAATQARDLAALRILTDARFPLGKPAMPGVRKLLDDTWDRVRGPHRDAELYGKPLDKYLRRLAHAVETCHALYDAEHRRAAPGDTADPVAGIAELVTAYRLLRESEPEAGAGFGTVAAPLGAAVCAALDEAFGCPGGGGSA